MFSNIGVYIIENTKTNKCYVGSTCVDFKTRFNRHLGSLGRNTHHSKKLQRSYNKHGKEAFKFRILEICGEQEVREKEQEWIDFLVPFYNMILIVDGGVDNHSYESRLKISKLQGGKPIDICDLEGNILKTVNFQNEAAEFVNGSQEKVWRCLQGIGNTHMGYKFKHSGEDFKYVPNPYTGPAPMEGKRHSQETKNKMSKASKGKKRSKKHRESISREMKKQWSSGERIQSPITEETRINMSRSRFNGILIVTDEKENELFCCWSIKDASSILNIKCNSIAGVLGGCRNSVYGYKFIKHPLVTDYLHLKSKEDLKERLL